MSSPLEGQLKESSREDVELKHALVLMKLVLEGLNPEDFTLEEIRAEFGTEAGEPGPSRDRRKFNPEHIELLLQKGLVELVEDGHYRISDEGRIYYETNEIAE